MRFPVLLFVLPVLSLAAGIACSGGEASTLPAGRGQAQAVPVKVARAERRSIPVEIRAIGTVEPYSTVAVRSQITGVLTAVNFTEGENVRAGQPLFLLDRRPLEAALQQAQAVLARDVAQEANAQLQAQRYQQLADRGIASREQLDSTLTGAAALSASVAADRAAVENATVQLQYATITAPMSGRTGALMAHPGNLVRANDTVPLVVINQVSPIHVSFAVPEARLAALKRFTAGGTLPVTAAPPSSGDVATGQLTFIDNAVDQTTGTIRVKATFPNADGRLWPGQFVNAAVTLTTDRDVTVVPVGAVQAGQQGSYVFVVGDDDTVALQPVKVARTTGEFAVIDDGVEAGDIVVTDGHLRLVAGSRVSIKTSVNPADTE